MAITVIKEIMCEYPPLCKNTNKNLLSPEGIPDDFRGIPDDLVDFS